MDIQETDSAIQTKILFKDQLFGLPTHHRPRASRPTDSVPGNDSAGSIENYRRHGGVNIAIHYL